MKKVIVTGDDFGLAWPVNEAIEKAHRQGILTTASLMVGADFAKDAVARAQRLPTLRVGLHLVLVEGKPVTPPVLLPDLVDPDGELPRDLVRSGFRFFFLPKVRRQLQDEIRAQFLAFQRTGLSLDHVNAHNHMHLHPTILGLILKIGRDFGLQAIRVPHEPPIQSWRASRTAPWRRTLIFLFLFPWLSLMKRRLRKAQIRFNDSVFGMYDSGAMTEARVRNILRSLPEGVTEIYFHPSTSRSPEIDRTMPNYRHEEEFRALTSALVRAELDGAGIKRISFSDL